MPITKRKILIVDDERDIVEILAEEFINCGHEIDIAFSGNEAIEKLKLLSFDVIISDYRMPNGNGMKLLAFVNSLLVKPNFFFLTAQADASDEVCLANGAKFIFLKPFDLDELIQKINELD